MHLATNIKDQLKDNSAVVQRIAEQKYSLENIMLIVRNNFVQHTLYEVIRGPYPRRGLDVSFFDLASFKNPRGHFYECLWNDNPKVYAATVKASDSEFKYVPDSGFRFEEQKSWHRRWLWYKAYDTWNYSVGDSVIIQGYTNCEEADVFINRNNFVQHTLYEVIRQVTTCI